MEYEAYALRIWREGRQVHGRWAARLERQKDGETYRFNDPQALLGHLAAAIAQVEESQMTGQALVLADPIGGYVVPTDGPSEDRGAERGPQRIGPI